MHLKLYSPPQCELRVPGKGHFLCPLAATRRNGVYSAYWSGVQILSWFVVTQHTLT